LNCNKNSSKNLRLIDGTLAITVIREKYLNKEYTSAKITTREGFTCGRFEIRAALPKGKMLRPAMVMIPMKICCWAKNGQINIMINTQDNELGAGIHYGTTSTTAVIIVSIISSFLLLVLISIVVFLLIRQKNLERINREKNIDNYDDICDPERYDAIYTHNKYTEPYEELPQFCVISEGTEKYEEMSDRKKDRNSNPRYLEMNKNEL
jgi:hypothetical protein